ncbi:MAG: 50S ribosomal protein L13 [Candidatus Bathyarchaeota archaeon]|nr:MAG: 50S ribosomal protein L13 [Candidatus Bathyarchaeota archaeon]
MNNEVLIDGSGLILGRLASNVAKQILHGEKVIIVNAEKIIITGNRKDILLKFKKRLETRTLGSQSKAPKHTRRPDTYVRRVIRGMLPWKKPKGKEAFKRLKVFIGIPEKLDGQTLSTIPTAKKTVQRGLTVGEMMAVFGWSK